MPSNNNVKSDSQSQIGLDGIENIPLDKWYNARCSHCGAFVHFSDENYKPRMKVCNRCGGRMNTHRNKYVCRKCGNTEEIEYASCVTPFQPWTLRWGRIKERPPDFYAQKEEGKIVVTGEYVHRCRRLGKGEPKEAKAARWIKGREPFIMRGEKK